MPVVGCSIFDMAIQHVPILLLFIEYRESSCEYHVAKAPRSEVTAGQQQATRIQQPATSNQRPVTRNAQPE